MKLREVRQTPGLTGGRAWNPRSDQKKCRLVHPSTGKRPEKTGNFACPQPFRARSCRRCAVHCSKPRWWRVCDRRPELGLV